MNQECIERDVAIAMLKQLEREPDYQHEGEDWRVGVAMSASMLYDVPAVNALMLPCKPGDKIYRIVRWGKRNIDIRERIVSSVEYNAAGEWVIHSTGDDVLGKNCFLTRAEAEKVLSERNKS